MVKTYFWDLLPLVKTELITMKDNEEDINSDTHLKSHARKVFFGDTASCNDSSVIPEVDMDILHSNVLDDLRLLVDTIDVDVETGDEFVDVSIGLQQQKVKVRKIPSHDMITEDIYLKGL